MFFSRTTAPDMAKHTQRLKKYSEDSKLKKKRDSWTKTWAPGGVESLS